METSVYCMQWQLLVEYLALVFLSINIICIVVFILCILDLWKKLMFDVDRIVYIRTLVHGDSLVLIQIHRYRCKSCKCPVQTYNEHSNGHKWKIQHLDFLVEHFTFSLSKKLRRRCCNARDCWDVKEHIKCSQVATSP